MSKDVKKKPQQQLRPARVFHDAVGEVDSKSSDPDQAQSSDSKLQITGISFDDRGGHIITAADDETFRLYNTVTGKHSKTLYSKKYGVTLPRFTHKDSCILHASTKVDNTIRYHSLHDNKYLQYFKGHDKRVVSLEMSPLDDTFLSASEDQTVKLWDLRGRSARGSLSLPAVPIAAFDSNGIVFAVAVNEYQRINLYDSKNFDKEPFQHIILHDPALEKISYPARLPYMTSLAFSTNGKFLLVGTSGDLHYVVDAFDGLILFRLVGFRGLERSQVGAGVGVTPTRGISGEEVTWTPDSKFVISGDLEGKICIWDLSRPIEQMPPPDESGIRTVEPLRSIEGHQNGPARCVKFNPRYMMLASAGPELAFWLLESEATQKLMQSASTKN